MALSRFFIWPDMPLIHAMHQHFVLYASQLPTWLEKQERCSVVPFRLQAFITRLLEFR